MLKTNFILKIPYKDVICIIIVSRFSKKYIMIRLIISYLGKRFGVGFSMVLQPVEVKRGTLPAVFKQAGLRNRY